jgi:hypothetical protein
MMAVPVIQMVRSPRKVRRTHQSDKHAPESHRKVTGQLQPFQSQKIGILDRSNPMESDRSPARKGEGVSRPPNHPHSLPITPFLLPITLFLLPITPQ